MKIYNSSEYREKLKIRSVNINDMKPCVKYQYFPNTKEELKELTYKLTNERGSGCDLNDIDVSKITDMRGLFRGAIFHGNISRWDVSSVTDMSFMFCDASSFNANISRRDTSNVTDMRFMFNDAKKFDQDLSSWDTKVGYAFHIFDDCPLENNKEKQPVFNK